MHEIPGMKKADLLVLIESWDNLTFTSSEILAHPEYYPVLMEVALYSKHPNSWRAAYLVDKIHEVNPELILPYIDKIIEQLKLESHKGKKRHFLKQISLNKLPEIYHGFLLDYCLNTFTSAKEAVAVRVHAMQILFNISEREPELKPEILAVIEHEMEYHSTAGILSRGKKLAQKLRRQINP